MDLSKYNTEDLEKLSYNELRKLGKENGVTGRKKTELISALQRLIWANDTDTSSVIQVKSSAVVAKKRRGVLNDISDVTGNSPEPPNKVHRGRVFCDDITVTSSLYSEFQNSDLAISSTPTKINISCNTTRSEDREKKLNLFSSNVTNAEERISNIINRFEESAKPMLNEIERYKLELENNKCEADNYLKRVLENELAKKETELRSIYSEEINNLKNEKESIQVKFGEQEKALLTQKEENKDLLNDLSKKQSKIEVLEEELEEKYAELSKQIELAKAIELSMKNSLNDEMEDEFTCIICQELIICAMTVPCGHTFCEICLRTWFKTKKTCPVCRRDIKLKVIPSVTLDSAVERLIESMDDEIKRKRLQVKRERNEQKRREDAQPDPQGIRAMFHGADDPDIRPPQNANRANTNRRRSRSQSPARAQQRNNQFPRQHAGGGVGGVNNANNMWRNNTQNNNMFNNNMNRYLVRCFRCGMYGHVSAHCTRR